MQIKIKKNNFYDKKFRSILNNYYFNKQIYLLTLYFNEI